MYETEANYKTESGDQIPPEALRQFQQTDGSIVERTVLPWSEHCTECVWPTCYSTCELYSPREDGRCRRFTDGMVRIECPEALNSYLLKIRFKRWAKLWTPGNIRLLATQQASKRERRDYWLGTTLYQLPLPKSIRHVAIGKRYSFKKRVASHTTSTNVLPTSFLLELYNPTSKIVQLTLTMRAANGRTKVPFQKLVEAGPGFYRVRIPFPDITRFLDLHSPFTIELTPNHDESETVLYFGLMDFVRETASAGGALPEEFKTTKHSDVKEIKCVVWDLDNTIWNGILVEDGLDKITLRPELIQILETLDERGILQSVASKNSRDEALAALAHFGIKEYFLHPQISWGPKSSAIKQIAAQLNIGTDTLLFVDDSEFELQQVAAVHPEVHRINASRYLEIPTLDICHVRVSPESRNRRKMYQVESERQGIAESFGDDYMTFLRYCDLRLTLRSLNPENLERVHELTQRTNQMNFSGNRYEKDLLKQILATSYLDTYVLDVEDRFGSYGIVGFSIIDRRGPLMTDLMFSCRVQAKRVEHAFLSYILRKYIAETGKDFYAHYRKTPRNEPSGQVFSDVGLREIEVREGVSRLVFPKDQEVPNDNIIRIFEPNLAPAGQL